MKTVHKFSLPIEDLVQIQLPYQAEVIAVGWQPNSGAQIWAIVDTNHRVQAQPRLFRIAGTGHDLAIKRDCLCFIGTFQIPERGLVFHVFEVIEPPDDPS